MCSGGAGQTKKKLDPLDRFVQEKTGFQGNLEKTMGNVPGPGPLSTDAEADSATTQAQVDALAAAKGGQDRTAARRRVRMSSLLATGGRGDSTAFATYTPGAKPVLGA